MRHPNIIPARFPNVFVADESSIRERASGKLSSTRNYERLRSELQSPMYTLPLCLFSIVPAYSQTHETHHHAQDVYTLRHIACYRNHVDSPFRYVNYDLFVLSVIKQQHKDIR